MQTESQSKLAFMAPTSSTEHSGELDLDRQPPLAGAAAPVLKRKRTNRPRHHLPASSASSSESTTTEEEDMAHCLILLAQGGAGAAVDSKPSPSPSPVAVVPQQQAQQPSPPMSTLPPPVVLKSSSERYTSRKYTEAATTADGVKAGFYVYECRTCNKCFPTFQALGGHRASHKKPRVLAGYDEVNNKPPPMTMTPSPQPPPPRVVVTTALSLNSHVVGSSKGVRVHECSICGAEFASGQALGGHMRRHRPLNAPPVTAITGSMDTTTTKKLEGSINLELDLNLPAPSSDEDLSPVVLGLGQFNDGNKAGLMLTASALVDCHY